MPTTAPMPDTAAFDSLPCPWLRIDTAGRIVAANQALSRLLCSEGAAITGTTLETWLNMASRVMLQTVVQPLLKLHGTVSEFALRLQPAQGAPGVDVLCYGHREGAGAQASVSMQLVPITQRRRIESELQRVKHAADQGTGMIFQLERETSGAAPAWRFPYASEAVRPLYGTSPDAVAQSAEPVFGRLHPEDRAALVAELAQSAQTGSTARALVRVTGAPAVDSAAAGPAPPRWHELHAVPRQRSGNLTLWHGQVADVTERVALQEAAVQRQALEGVAQARSDFIARVSHELRTPLNGILGFAQLMGGDVQQPLAGAQAERLGVILQSGRHLLGVVNELLEISRIEAGQLDLLLQPVSADDALARVCTEMRPQADARDIALELPASAVACMARAEPQRLHQVLLNLVSNAIKYNRRGGCVKLSAVVAEGEVCIHVRDTGPGLSTEQQAALFQPFNRLGAERGAVEGTGLGLVLSRHLAGLMGGRVLVDSTPGAGSTFSLCLPQATATHARRARAVPAAAAAAPQASRGRVLYAEDNPVNAVLMEAIIAQRPGVQLVVCSDGASACHSALDTPPSLLLLDMHLPDGSGLELLQKLRALPGLQAVPAVVVSASAGSDVEARALSAGFDGYWTKPLDLARTLAELDRWLQRAL